MNGLEGLVAKRADEAYKQAGSNARSSFHHVFSAVVGVHPRTGARTRRRAEISRFEKNPDALALVAAFTDKRLLVRSAFEHSDTANVEVAHETLLSAWPRLDAWIEAQTDHLRLIQQFKSEAALWDKRDRPTQDGDLWPPPKLKRLARALESLDESEFSEAELRFKRDWHEWQIERLFDANLTHAQRQRIGDDLAEHGDLRPGVGLTDAGLPDIVWVGVPAGGIALEENAGMFEVGACEISAYPVTYRQYRAFFAADEGYDDPAWWPHAPGGVPKELGKQYRAVDNHPADTVSWFEAVAFCNWLSARLGEAIRLRYEWEWQQAAIGGDATRVYPWGDEWNAAHANTYESQNGRTVAVGLYPEDRSPCGAFDMSGNVWEWCLNPYASPNEADLTSLGSRVLRGGSWYNGSHGARGLS